VDNHCRPNAPACTEGKDIKANSIKVEITLTQVAQSAFPEHHSRAMDTLGRAQTLYPAFLSWKSMERYREGPLWPHRQLSQESFLLNC
jgi:hypothetical protein